MLKICELDVIQNACKYPVNLYGIERKNAK